MWTVQGSVNGNRDFDSLQKAPTERMLSMHFLVALRAPFSRRSLSPSTSRLAPNSDSQFRHLLLWPLQHCKLRSAVVHLRQGLQQPALQCAQHNDLHDSHVLRIWCL